MTEQMQPNDRPHVTIHHRLRIAREWAGMDQDQLAQATAIARNTISNYETGGTTHLKPGYLKLISMATGAPLSFITDGDETGGTSPTSGYRRWFARSSRIGRPLSGTLARPVATAA